MFFFDQKQVFYLLALWSIVRRFIHNYAQKLIYMQMMPVTVKPVFRGYVDIPDIVTTKQVSLYERFD